MTVRRVGRDDAMDGRLIWQTPLARDLLKRYYGTSAPAIPQPS